MKKYNENIDINYDDTKSFFEGRLAKNNSGDLCSVTMYQSEEVAKRRNAEEIEKLFSVFNPESFGHVIDIGCGMGRWANNIKGRFKEYLGIDYSETMIRASQEYYKNENNVHFQVASVQNLKRKDLFIKSQFNLLILSGIFIYLNDNDLEGFVEFMLECADEKECYIYIREPVSTLSDRLTLKNFYSDELNEEYNAIYRSEAEMQERIFSIIESKGKFSLIYQDNVFNDPNLNNRKETKQKLFLFKR